MTARVGIAARDVLPSAMVWQLSGWLAGDVKESRNGNPTRDLQMAADPNPASSLYGVRGIRYSLSLRDVEELLAERGLKVDHTTVWCWVSILRP